jgi:hypothetical protein
MGYRPARPGLSSPGLAPSLPLFPVQARRLRLLPQG